MDQLKLFIKRLSSHSLFKSSAVVFVGSMTANVSGWLYHLFVGRILGSQQYGELAALFSLFYILNVPASVLQTVLVKFFSVYKANREQGKAKTLLFVATKKLFLIEIVGFLAIIPFISFVANFLHIQSRLYFVWLYFIFASFMLSVINTSALQAFQRFTESSIFANLGMVLRLVIGVPLAFFGVGWTLVGNIFSNIVSYLLSFLPIAFLLRATPVELTLTKRRAFAYSVPAFLTTLGLTALYSQDVLLVKHFFTSHEAGIYASLSILGKVIFFASAAVGFVLFPVVAERAERHEPHGKIVLLGLLSIGGMCFVLTILYFLFPQYVTAPFGRTFAQAQEYLGLFAIFISFFSLSNILISVLLAIDKMFVWVLTMTAALLQAIGIYQFHVSLWSVIFVNVVVATGLFSAVLVYYLYAKEPS